MIPRQVLKEFGPPDADLAPGYTKFQKKPSNTVPSLTRQMPFQIVRFYINE